MTWGFHEGTGALYSHMNTLYGENRFYRHVASHWIEMQQALIAMIIGGVFEFHPRLRVGFLEAQNSWVPGSSRASSGTIRSTATRTRRTCRSRRRSTSGATAGRPSRAASPRSRRRPASSAPTACASRPTIPHFDSNFPEVSNNLLKNVRAGDRRPDLHGRRATVRLQRGGLRQGRRGGAPRRGAAGRRWLGHLHQALLSSPWRERAAVPGARAAAVWTRFYSHIHSNPQYEFVTDWCGFAGFKRPNAAPVAFFPRAACARADSKALRAEIVTDHRA